MPLAAGAAGGARRRDRGAADPEGDELPAPGRYYNDEKFVRPAHRLVALHGADVVPVTALGLAAGRTTQGHRFLSRKRHRRSPPPTPTSARSRPRARSSPSFAARRAAHRAWRSKARAGDATPIMPDALLDEVTALVEWPVGLRRHVRPGVPRGAAGVPDPHDAAEPEVLRARRRDGKLVDRFLLVSNLRDLAIRRAIVRRQRARAARAAGRREVLLRPGPQGDARSARAAGCEAVVYHNKLGTQARARRARAPARRGHRADGRRRRGRTPSAPRCWPRPTSSPTWSASSPSCRA